MIKFGHDKDLPWLQRDTLGVRISDYLILQYCFICSLEHCSNKLYVFPIYVIMKCGMNNNFFLNGTE